jgi:HCOMODA/2-hydroxy-3-carboxy-muconic semialdehyde decarboxylase
LRGPTSCASTLDGNAAGDARTPYLERFIHGEIYRARPDVNAIVHSHSLGVIPFGVASGTRLRAICHMSGFSAPRRRVRDPHGRRAASDLLIRSQRSGAALARSLGSNAGVLMRGHGSTVVGTSRAPGGLRAVYTEINAAAAVEALRSGRVTYLTDQEAELASASNDSQINRAWELWKMLAAEGPRRAATKSRPPRRVPGPSAPADLGGAERARDGRRIDRRGRAAARVAQRSGNRDHPAREQAARRIAVADAVAASALCFILMASASSVAGAFGPTSASLTP